MTSAKKSKTTTDDTITVGDVRITLPDTLPAELRGFVTGASNIALNTKQKLAAAWIGKCVLQILQMHYTQTVSDKESERVERVLDEEIAQHEFVRELLIREIKALRAENDRVYAALDYHPDADDYET